MFFDWNEIHTQASADFINGKWVSGHSSSSTFHDFQLTSFPILKKSGILNFKNSKMDNSGFLNFAFFEFHISTKYFPRFPRMFPDVSWFVQTFWSNKMKKYGVAGPKISIIHEMLSFRCLMPWNRHFISLAWRRKIQSRH